MVGFVREGRKSGGRFNERLSEEARIAQIVADKKAAKARELEGAKAER